LNLRLELGFQPSESNPSCFSAETDGHKLTVDNYRHSAGTVGMFQHGIQLVRVRNDIMILYYFAFLRECFPSSVGVRSGILSKNQNFFRHAGFPPKFTFG
jgi:hypothetical protein